MPIHAAPLTLHFHSAPCQHSCTCAIASHTLHQLLHAAVLGCVCSCADSVSRCGSVSAPLVSCSWCSSLPPERSRCHSSVSDIHVWTAHTIHHANQRASSELDTATAAQQNKVSATHTHKHTPRQWDRESGHACVRFPAALHAMSMYLCPVLVFAVC